jgi:16S rRNA (guanine527-N7)-methyltransferase
VTQPGHPEPPSPTPEPHRALDRTPLTDAHAVFGTRLDLAEVYASRLATDGVQQGLIGPHEIPRLWDRHLINSAILTDLVPVGARVVDVGSGAGLPGLPMAIRRPDLRIDLLEPMLRRVSFLTEVITELGLTESVRAWRGRAEEPDVLRDLGHVDWVVARAVAPLDRLVRWCLPLLAPGGRLLALKGAKAADEVREHRQLMRKLGAGSIDVQVLGSDVVAEPTWVVSVERAIGASSGRRRGGKR